MKNTLFVLQEKSKGESNLDIKQHRNHLYFFKIRTKFLSIKNINLKKSFKRLVYLVNNLCIQMYEKLVILSPFLIPTKKN